MVFEVRPIGFVRSPFAEKIEAPRQATVGDGVRGTIEVSPEHEGALADLAGFSRIWVIFWFDRAAGRSSASKVLPPRSSDKRGVFATRSPHRPNPIGLSAVRLEGIDGRVLSVRDLDLLDGTPVLDLKPYLPYADAFPDETAGWLDTERDPRPSWTVLFTPRADEQLAWLEAQGVDLRARITPALALGPQPHAYRRIKKEAAGTSVLAAKEWRARFVESGAQELTVQEVFSGYRERELATGKAPALHCAFVTRFG